MSIGGRWAMGCRCCRATCANCRRFLWFDTFCSPKLQYMRLKVAGLSGQCADLAPCNCDEEFGDPFNDSFVLRRTDDRTFRRVHRRGGIDALVELSPTYGARAWPLESACPPEPAYAWTTDPTLAPDCARLVSRVLVTGPAGRRVEVTWDAAGNRQFVRSGCANPCDVELTLAPLHVLRLFPDECDPSARTVSMAIGGITAGTFGCCTALNGSYSLALVNWALLDCNAIPLRYELVVDKGSGCVVTAFLALSSPGPGFCDEDPEAHAEDTHAEAGAHTSGDAVATWVGARCDSVTDPQGTVTLNDWETESFTGCGGTAGITVSPF